jgi:hypothetical protein
MAPVFPYYQDDLFRIQDALIRTNTFTIHFREQRKRVPVKSKQQIKDERSAKISKNNWYTRNQIKPKVFKTLNKINP